MTDAKRCPATLASTYAENDVLLVDTNVTVTGALTLVPGAVLRTHQSLAEKLATGAGASTTAKRSPSWRCVAVATAAAAPQARVPPKT